MKAKQRLVVVGNGMAGARFVEEVVARGGRDLFEIVVFGEEPNGNYNRILLSGVLSGEYNPADTFMSTVAWYAENGVRLHAGVRAGWIDRIARVVHALGGIAEPYDKLVLATGSIPIVPLVEGVMQASGEPKPGIFVFRTLDDCAAIIRHAGQVSKAVVIGGGLLGLEAARGLLDRGLRVDVVHLMPFLMEQQLDATAGALLKTAVEELGIGVHLEKVTASILGTDEVVGLSFKDGSTIDCEMVIVCAGIRPNVDLARQAGLSVQRGIVVNDDLSTRNDPNIYAIGECAQHRGQVYGLVPPLWEQALALAQRLTEADPHATYTGSSFATKLKVAGVDLTVIGEKIPAPGDEVVTYVEPTRGVYKKLLVRDGRLAGGILLGDGAGTPRVIQAFDRGETLPENRADLLFSAAGESQAAGPSRISDSALVCFCNSVSKEKIVSAVLAGHCTPKAVQDATRAGTGCGACKPDVRAVVEFVSRADSHV